MGYNRKKRGDEAENDSQKIIMGKNILYNNPM